MRGPDIQQEALFSTVSPSDRVPQDHVMLLSHFLPLQHLMLIVVGTHINRPPEHNFID